MSRGNASKPKVAFFDFTSCEGCQLTVLDTLQTDLGLLDAVVIVNFREAMSQRGEDYQVAFIEGSCSCPGDEERLRQIREQADVVVALGACAHLGGINAIRNRQPLPLVREVVYGDKAEWYDTYAARPVDRVIEVDMVIPGCPIDGEEFAAAVKMLLQGRTFRLPETPLCVECKMRENTCVYSLGKTCLGPVIRAGCKAICPAYGDGCEGCRGMISQPNMEALEEVLREHNMAKADIDAKLSMFLAFQLDRSSYREVKP